MAMVIDLNVTSAMLMTKHLYSSLVNTNGNIINISSIAGVQPYFDTFSYCIAKAAMDQMTKCMALELKDKSIRVNCIRPSTTETNFFQNMGLSKDEIRRYYEATEKMHKVIDVNHVIELVLFLADNTKSNWITGECINIDGGRLLLSPDFVHG